VPARQRPPAEESRRPHPAAGGTREQQAAAPWRERAEDSQVFGVQPVLEVLRAGRRPIERLTIAEGAHERRLDEIFDLARREGIPIRRAPRAELLEYVPVARAANVARLVDELKERGVWTVGTAADAPTPYTEWDWTQPCALLLGGEGEGLRRLVREHCDVLVSIPMRGRVESLNVSVAAGVVLFEALRQRTAARSREQTADTDG
jgi:tRNA G18 (ribose-2'-O)-methylase SpoU